jgi:very-short-patch-repair endonuclease
VRLSYNPRLKQLARQLRNQSTVAEVLLWQQLKGSKRRGCDFHRQKPIDEYIVDFFAADLMLAIEIDGESHDLKGLRDETRQRRLESLGIRFLRFDDALVKSDLDAVVRAIDRWIDVHRAKA